jgi:hypothetical protein
MSSNKTDVSHDHIYLSNIDIEKDCLNKNELRRRIHRKSDIQTDEDQEEYERRRVLNNAACRISRIYRQSKVHQINKKCTEYEALNTKLQLKNAILLYTIDRLKEHLRSLVPKSIQQT